jgi:hypothetical protein
MISVRSFRGALANLWADGHLSTIASYARVTFHHGVFCKRTSARRTWKAFEVDRHGNGLP